jgi:hypothetical protein
MSIRAKARMAAEAERERARLEAEWQTEKARVAEEQRPEFEAGPPNGCRDCYVWAPEWLRVHHYTWMHGGHSVKPGPPPLDALNGPLADLTESHWCWHECHGGEAPRYCGPIAMAACR